MTSLLSKNWQEVIFFAKTHGLCPVNSEMVWVECTVPVYKHEERRTNRNEY